MKTLRNTLYFSLTLQVCIAAGIFAAAEEAPLTLGTLPLALGTLLLIDLLGWVRPPTFLLNLMALAAFGAAFSEFRDDWESRLLAGGHLITYLTWTYLLQVKDMQRMWWIFALTVLQVAMAALLTIQPWFGASLFVYTASAVWTMSLLSLTRAALLADPQLLTPGAKALPTEEAIDSSLALTSVARNGVRTDEHGRWISPRFLGGTSVTLALMLVVGMAFFVLTPRVWIGSLNGEANASMRRGGSATGFAKNIKLGDIGQVMESRELVMQVSVFDADESPIPAAELAAAVGDEPLFRGAVLENYLAGGWTEGAHPESEWRQAYAQESPIHLKITLQPVGSPLLFYPGFVFGAQGVSDTAPIVFHRMTQAYKRTDTDLEKPYSYSLDIIPPATVQLEKDRPWEQEQRLQNKEWIRQHGWPESLRNLLPTPSARLTQLARDVLERSTADGALDSEATARVLESYLRDSNEFNYTLDLSITDPTIDPVEDFVFNRKKGHCEYFSSALALMLRGIGVPTRLISGFKGAEYNSTAGNLEIRDLHAHAWLEAFVDGGWITLDPTPGQRDTEVATKAKESGANLAEQTRSIWFQGMNYNTSQQDTLVYAPLREIGSVLRRNFEGLMQGEFPLLNQIKTLATSPSQWLSGAGSLFGLLLLLSLAGIAWFSRSLFRRWKGWTQNRDLAHRRDITIEFYARLMALLSQFGLEDIQTLTPREFAQRAEDQFQTRFHQAGISGISLLLVEMFYAVRFGEHPLTADQLRTVDQKLAQLEGCLLQPET